MNLIDGGMQHSNLFLHMPLFDQITYEGYLEGMVRKYKAVRENQACQILSLNVIRKDEEIIWDALEDMIKRAIVQAAPSTHGVFVFDLLTVDIHNEVKTFKVGDLATTIINHAAKLNDGQKRLVKYSSVFGLLQKLVTENWGKITLKSSVEVFADKPVFLDLLIKELLKNFAFAHGPSILFLNDLSQKPLFDINDAQQQGRLKKVLDEQIPQAIEFLPEVFIQDKNGVRELLSGEIIVGR